MATERVLLIDDDPTMESLLLGPVGLIASAVERDASGDTVPDPRRHGLVLVNAELPRSFELCRRFRDDPGAATVPLALYTYSHNRVHLRLLAEHRSLPSHADHYLFPAVTAERVRELLDTVFRGAAAPEDPVAEPADPPAGTGDDPDVSFGEAAAAEPTGDLAPSPEPLPPAAGNGLHEAAPEPPPEPDPQPAPEPALEPPPEPDPQPVIPHRSRPVKHSTIYLRESRQHPLNSRYHRIIEAVFHIESCLLNGSSFSRRR